jgi:tetratricopeptide (TPR) repeat protein
MRRWFLSYHSPDQALAERLKAAIERQDAGARVFFAPTNLRAGGRWAPALAAAIAEATAFVLLVTDSGVGRWQEIEYEAAFDKHVNSPDFPVVLMLLEGRAAPRLSFLKHLHWIVTVDPASETDVSRLIDAVASGDEAKPNELWRYTSPYRGLSAMEEKDSDYFFGRERETADVLSVLAAETGRLPVLLGNSGVGKSSLAQAGVVAALRRQAWPEAAGGRAWPAPFEKSRSWCFLTLKPGVEPIKSLVEAFLRTWQYDATDPEWEERRKKWVEWLSDGRATVRGLLDATERRYEENGQPKPAAFFLYVDQGEELYVRGERQRRRFSELLADVIADPRLVALMSMRSDFLGHLQSDEPLFAVHRKIDVPPLRETELSRVITEPALQLSARFESEELVTVITRRTLEDSAKDVGALPLLSYTLDDMWTEMVRRGDGVLRVPAVAFELGGVLARRANAFLERNPNSEGVLRRILTIRLATVRKQGDPTRRRALRSEFSDDEWRLASELADHPNRLLITATPEIGETYAEVAHEAIFRRWDNLRGWIESERDFLTWKSSLDDDRRRWQGAPIASKNEALLSGLALAQAQAWLVQRGEDLSKFEREFIDLSQKIDTERREASRQLEIQRIRAEEEITRLSAQNEAQEQRERAAKEEVGRLRAEQEAQKQRERASREEVARLRTENELREGRKRRLRLAVGAAILAAGLITAYLFDEKSRQATRNFEIVVSSAQKLLDQVTKSLDRGNLSAMGANDMLQVAKGIVDQMQEVKSTIKTVGLLIHLENTVSDIHEALGNRSLAYENARKAKELAQTLQRSNPDNPEVLQLSYGSLWRLGDAISYKGGGRAAQQQALAEYLEAQKFARRLAEMAPEDGARQRELMFIHQKIGDERQALGDIDAAIAEYRTALAIIQKVAASAHEKRDWLRDVATTHRRIGGALAAKGDFGRALDELNGAIEIIRGLAKEDPGNDAVLSNLAANHHEIGHIYAHHQDLDNAAKEYKRAGEIQERLIARDRDNASWQLSLASYYASLGAILRQQGDLAGALERYRKEYALRQELARKEPTILWRQNSLANAAISVADVLKEQKQDLEEAATLYSAAIAIQDEARPAHDDDVFHSYIKIGDIRILQDQRADALTEYERAWAIARDSAAGNVGSVTWQENLMTSHVKIGDLLATDERANEALKHYRVALEIAATLVVNNPTSAKWSPYADSLKAKIQLIRSKP